ncbi:MAG: hypothetical protein ACKO5E_08875 [bacterium]
MGRKKKTETTTDEVSVAKNLNAAGRHNPAPQSAAASTPEVELNSQAKECSPESVIRIRGAREHNLRGVNVDLPRGQLICMTGVSGSGKSSLAFDTLFAEGQRRYVESLSSYARQFLGQLPKPDVDRIDGLSPAIAIQQKTAGRNPRSTVGTITEISDYLRVLYARVGQGHCPTCGDPVQAQSRDQILGHIEHRVPEDQVATILAPLVRGQRGEHLDLFEDLSRQGFVRARVDGQMINLGEDLNLDRRLKHDIEVVIDRFTISESERTRHADAIDSALKTGGGSVIVALDDGQSFGFSSKYACGRCGVGFPPPSPQLFSFNSPQGWCQTCQGLGTRRELNMDKLIDPEKSLWDGAIKSIEAWRNLPRKGQNESLGLLAALIGLDDAGEARIFAETPWCELDTDLRKMLWMAQASVSGEFRLSEHARGLRHQKYSVSGEAFAN